MLTVAGGSSGPAETVLVDFAVVAAATSKRPPQTIRLYSASHPVPRTVRQSAPAEVAAAASTPQIRQTALHPLPPPSRSSQPQACSTQTVLQASARYSDRRTSSSAAPAAAAPVVVGLARQTTTSTVEVVAWSSRTDRRSAEVEPGCLSSQRDRQIAAAAASCYLSSRRGRPWTVAAERRLSRTARWKAVAVVLARWSIRTGWSILGRASKSMLDRSRRTLAWTRRQRSLNINYEH